MARALLFAILAMCLVCIIQCSPVPDQEVTTVNPLKGVEDAVNSAMARAKEGIESVVNDPNVKKFVEDLSKAARDGLDKLREQADKVLPATS